jgi:O-antigen/teichoic acid export membrane protein
MIDSSLETKISQVTQPSDFNREIVTAAKGGGIDFAGQVITLALRFVFGAILARYLGAEQFGLYTLGFTIVTIVGTLSALGLVNATRRFAPVAIRQRDQTELWGIIQVSAGLPGLISLSLATLTFILAEPIALYFFGEPKLTPIIRVLSLTIPLEVISDSLAAVIQSYKKLQYNVYARDITFNGLKLVLSLAALMLGLGMMGVLYIHVVVVLIVLAMLLFFVNGLFPLRRPFQQANRDPGKLLRHSLPVYGASLVNRFSGTFETLVLGFLGLTAGVGIYNIALRLSSLGNMFYGSLNNISEPIVADLYSRGEHEQLKRYYQIVTKWAVMFNLPIFLTIVLFTGPLLSVFGSEFVSGTTGTIILALAALLNAATGNTGVIINMTGNSRLSFFNSLAYLGSTLILDFILIPRWGVLGAAIAGGGTIVILNIIRMVEVYILLRVWPFNWGFLKPISAGLLAISVAYTVTHWLTLKPEALQVIMGVVILWGTYVVTIMGLKLSKEDQLILKKLRNRFNAFNLARS